MAPSGEGEGRLAVKRTDGTSIIILKMPIREREFHSLWRHTFHYSSSNQQVSSLAGSTNKGEQINGYLLDQLRR